VTKVYFQLHASLRFVSLFNVEAALAAQMLTGPAHLDFTRRLGWSVHYCLYVYVCTCLCMRVCIYV